MAKRVLSLLLALVMALSLCVPAFAAEGTDAAAEGEADEPATIALKEPKEEGVDEAVAKLKASVAELEALKADIESGAKTYDFTASDTPTYSNFYDVIADAKAVVEKIDDNQSKVTAAEITTAQTALNPYLKDPNGDGTPGQKYPYFITGPSRYDKAELAKYFDSGWTATEGLIDETSEYEQSKYQPDYLEKVAALRAEYKTLTENVLATHKQYVDMLAKAKELKKGEADAQKPATDDVQRLKDAIAKAKALKKDDYTELSYEKLISTKDANGAVNKAEALIDRAEYMETTALLKAINDAIDAIDTAIDSLVKRVMSVDLTSAYMKDVYKTVVLNITTDKLDTTKEADENKYVLTAQMTGGEEKVAASYPIVDAVGINSVGTSVDFDWDTLKPTSSTDSQFPSGAVITFRLYTNNNAKTELKDCVKVDELVYTVDGKYNGPKIVKAEWTKGADTDQVVVTLDKALSGDNYPSAKLTVTDANGKVVATKALDGSNARYNLTVKAPVVGEYTVDLLVVVKNSAQGEQAEENHGTATVECPDITEYEASPGIDDTKWAAADTLAKKVEAIGNATGYDVLEVVYAEALNYQSYVGKGANVTSQVYEIMGRLLADAEELIADAPTTVYDSEGKKLVDEMIKDLVQTLKKLEEPTALSALEDAIKEANALNKSDYASGWDALQAAVKAGQAILDAAAKGTNPSATDVAAKAKAITDAIKLLKINPTDKTALENAIDAVPSDLNTGNYSPDAVAAVKEALAAAQAVKADRDAPQSKCDAAASALLAAIGALKTVDGWVQAANGDFYYYKNGQMVKNQWVMSTRGLWYHMSASGVMDTGLTYIVSSDPRFGSGWYYLQESNRSDNCIGMMLKGWQKIIDDNGYGAGNIGWFETRTNGHGGKCTYTNEWGDFKNYVKQ